MAFPIKQLRPAEYPPLLREIPQLPALLYVRGALPCLPAGRRPEMKCLCVVGSRASSAYGRRQTQKLIAGLRKYPIAVISGMALGIDSEAHKAALDVGLTTVAVLPSSVDDASLYPRQNHALAKRILEQDGALVSEYKAPYKAMTHSFPARNRIMTGLSHATLVIEAGEKSGTLITARLALDYNREVLAIPHELDKESGAGVNRLLKEGATVVTHSNDILRALGFSPDEDPLQAMLPTDLSPAEAAVMEHLREAMVLDELIERAGLSAQEASIALSSLLIRGLVNERLGKLERA
jgi:DNA processing protein